MGVLVVLIILPNLSQIFPTPQIFSCFFGLTFQYMANNSPSRLQTPQQFPQYFNWEVFWLSRFWPSTFHVYWDNTIFLQTGREDSLIKVFLKGVVQLIKSSPKYTARTFLSTNESAACCRMLPANRKWRNWKLTLSADSSVSSRQLSSSESSTVYVPVAHAIVRSSALPVFNAMLLQCE